MLFEHIVVAVMVGREKRFPIWYNWVVYPICLALFYVVWGISAAVNKITDWRRK